MTENYTSSLRGQIIQKAQTDEAFRASFLKDPVAILNQYGVTVPPGIQIKVLEDTGDTFHIVIPKRQGELSDEQLDGIAGGFSNFFFADFSAFTAVADAAATSATD